MKREIVCERCQPPLRGLYATDEPYPGEHVRFVHGRLLAETEAGTDVVVCDQCGYPLRAGGFAWAFSAWADYGGVPYFEWEDRYLADPVHVPAEVPS